MGETTVAIDSDELRLGSGELPRELDRLNWGAALLGILWALIYAPWPWFFILAALRIALVVTNLRVYGLVPPGWAQMAFTAGYVSIYWVAVSVFATRANRVAWEGERRRVLRQSDQSVPRPAMRMSDYLAVQRKWVIGGVIFHLLMWGNMVYLTGIAIDGAGDIRGRYVSIAVDVAAVAILFAYDRMARRRAAS